MTCSDPVGTCLAVVLFATAGCFVDAPGTDDSGSTADGSGGSSSVTTAPEDTGVDADTTHGGVDGTDGNDGSGSSGDTDPCDPQDPECVAPGEELWTVTHDGGHGHDGAYSVIVDGDGDVVVAGEEAANGGNGDPWFARYDADGELSWSTASATGEGVDVVRGLIALGDGRVLAAGSTSPGGTNSDGYLEALDVDGASLASRVFDSDLDDHFLGAALVGGDSPGLWAVGGVGSDAGAPMPVMVHYAGDTPESWTIDFATNDVDLLVDLGGTLFGVAISPEGNLVAVGHAQDGEDQQGLVVVMSPAGEMSDKPRLFGGSFADGFVDIAIDDDGSAIAVGGHGTDGGSEIWIASLDLGETTTLAWERTWGAASFSTANGFARDGDELYIAAGVADGDPVAEAFDALILRWDGDAEEPTWTSPYAADSPNRDYAMDVALAPDGTVVACGVYSPDATQEGDAWVRKLAR